MSLQIARPNPVPVELDLTLLLCIKGSKIEVNSSVGIEGPWLYTQIKAELLATDVLSKISARWGLNFIAFDHYCPVKK